MKKMFRRIALILCCVCIWCPIKASAEADRVIHSIWYQSTGTAWNNIYGIYYWDYSRERFANGTFLKEVLNGNITPEGAAVYLDHGYFTEYVEEFREKNLIPEGYQLPSTYYVIVEIGGTFKMGVYDAPHIVTDCPEGMEQYLYWVNYYQGNKTSVNAFRDYVPKYIREERGEFANGSGIVLPCQHEYASELVKEPTCAETGVKKFTCILCDDIYEESIAKTNQHNYQLAETKEPTCAEEGYFRYACIVCGKSYDEAIAKSTEHAYQAEVTTEATCVEYGVLTYICKICDASYTEDIAKIEHDFVYSEDSYEPTCTKRGIYKEVCIYCGAVSDKAIEPLGCVMSDVPVLNKAPGCVEEGLQSYHCTRCDAVLKQENIVAIGHEEGNALVVEEATFFADGTEHYNCVTCQELLRESVVPNTGGNWRYILPGGGIGAIGIGGVTIGHIRKRRRKIMEA